MKYIHSIPKIKKRGMCREGGGEMKCHKCGSERNEKDDNFCRECSAKLKPTCKCWVLKKDNYSCGEESCPGYKLYKKLQAK